jgi:hypothetical protein
VDRLKEAGAGIAEAGGRREAEPAREPRCEVGEDVSEGVLGEEHVELGRREHELHRGVVDEHVLERELRVTARHVRRDASPET